MPESDSKKAEMTAEVIRERDKRRYVRKDGGFKKGMSDGMLAEGIKYLKEIGVHDEDIQHDLDLLQAGTRTGTERLRWSAEVHVPGMKQAEAKGPIKLENTQILQQTIASQGELLRKLAAQVEALIEERAVKTGVQTPGSEEANANANAKGKGKGKG